MIYNLFKKKSQNLITLRIYKFLFFIFGSITISASTFIFIENKKSSYPFNEELTQLSNRLIHIYNEFRTRGSLTKNLQKDLFSFDQFIESAWHNINKRSIDASNYLYDYYQRKELPGGYVDLISENRLIGTNGKGEMFLYDINKNKFGRLRSNLNQIYDDQNYQGKNKLGLKGAFGVRDIFYDQRENKIFASITLDITNSGCFGMGIYQSNELKNSEDLLNNEIIFNQYFKTKECNKNFKGHASGGRIKKMGENIIFTVGSLDVHTTTADGIKAESQQTAIGKIISINPEGEFKVISTGHRNQQGLYIFGNSIISTEHGPKGGDEINIIESGKHYGWPYFSYGYDYDDADKFRSPHVGKYTKPIFYFTPSIGISEIIFYEGEEFPRWNNKFLVSSLKEKSLYLLDTDFKQMKVLSSEKITIGHRIRDLNTLKDGRIIIVTDDQKLLILSRTNAPRSNPKAFKKIPIIKSVN